MKKKTKTAPGGEKAPMGLATMFEARKAGFGFTKATFWASDGARLQLSGPAWPDAHLAAYVILCRDLTKEQSAQILQGVKDVVGDWNKE